MKRSRAVRLTLAASATASAAAPSACAAPSARAADALHCVERGSSRVVPDSLCDAARRTAAGAASGTFGEPAGASGAFGDSGKGTRAVTGQRPGSYGGGSNLPFFLWYYGGRVANGYASAGSYAPSEGVRYRSGAGYAATGTARRGFFSRVFGNRAGGGFGGGAERGGAARGGISRGGFGSTGAGHASAS